MTAKTVLSAADVKRLLSDSSTEARVETAEKISAQFAQNRLNEAERVEAERIFRLMAEDAEVRVRQALTSHLKDCPNLPRDLAVRLARDVESVSIPILRFSTSLADDDLVDIVHGREPPKQIAVANRTHVSKTVSAALLDTGTEDVVAALISNDGADIAEPDLRRAVDEFGESTGVRQAFVGRSKLPVTVTEKLVALISDSFRESLIASQRLPVDLIAEIVIKTRERATVTLSTQSDDESLAALIRHLRGNARLTPSLVLRALCMGEIRFFEAAIAELAGVRLVSAQILIHDSGKYGLRSICEKAGLPANYLSAFRIAIEVSHETQYDGGGNDHKRFARRMIERILTQYENLDIDMESGDLDYLMNKMTLLPQDRLPLAADAAPARAQGSRG